MADAERKGVSARILKARAKRRREALSNLGIVDPRPIKEIPFEELLILAVRAARPDEGPFACEDVSLGQAMKGLVTDAHIDALCDAAAKAVLAAMDAAGFIMVPHEDWCLKQAAEELRSARLINASPERTSDDEARMKKHKECAAMFFHLWHRAQDIKDAENNGAV